MRKQNNIKFNSGQLFFSRGINDKIADDAEFARFIIRSLRRHLHGDWGDLCDEDKTENEFSLDKYLRLFSAYVDDATGKKIWIITEADRRATTILFPREY